MDSVHNDEPLYRLLYVSKPTVAAGHERTAQIADILREARTNNARNGLTGALVHSDNWFGQVLEGPQSALDRIFQTIQDDPRHRAVRVMELARIEHRVFEQWAMGEVEDFGPAQFDLVVQQVVTHGAAPDPLFFDMTNQFMGVLRVSLKRCRST